MGIDRRPVDPVRPDRDADVGRLWRRVIGALLLLSLIPLVFSLNRGAWIALIVLVAYAAIRFAAAGDYRAVRAILAVVAVAVVVTLATPLGGLIVSRLQHGHSDAGRQTRDIAALELGNSRLSSASERHNRPPIRPRPQSGHTAKCSSSSSHRASRASSSSSVGSPTASSERRKGIAVVFWCHVVILLFLVQMPFYELTAFQLMVLAAALALAWREIVASRPAPAGQATRRAWPGWLRPHSPLVLEPRGMPWTAPAWLGGLRARERPHPARRPRERASAEAEPTAHVHRSDLSNVARGGALGIAGGIAFGVFGFVLLLVVSHGLGATLAGIFFEAVALFMIFTRIAQIGADVGMVRAMSRLVALGRQHDIPSHACDGRPSRHRSFGTPRRPASSPSPRRSRTSP